MNKLYTIHSSPGIEIRAMSVPGGMLMITETYQTNVDGFSKGVATSFVPMSDDDARSFVKGRE